MRGQGASEIPQPPPPPLSPRISCSPGSSGESSPRRMIDELLGDEAGDIADRVHIVLKTEPLSPIGVDLETAACDELESCLRLVHEHQDAGTSSARDELSLALLGSSARQRRCSSATQSKSGSSSTAKTFCGFCRKSFSRAWSLQRHMADTHFYVPQSLACDLCGRSYKSRNSLVSHKSQYHSKRERKEHETQQLEITY